MSKKKFDHIFPSRIDFLQIYPESPFTVVFTHGMNPIGAAYCGESFQPLLKICDKNKLSHFVYYRQYYLKDGVINDICDAQNEYKDLMSTIKNLSLSNKNILLVGHSLGGAYAHIFNYLNNEKNIIRSISLDGTDFYLAIPYFIMTGYRLKEIDERDIEYLPNKILYKRKQVPFRIINCSESLYQMVYKFKDKICDTHHIVDYYANQKRPKSVIFRKIPDKYYLNVYELKYYKEYWHSLHEFPAPSQVIFDKLIAPLISQYTTKS